jgi:hypothetical protein
MGTEALSKKARRDIRRAFSPEASAEVFRFVAHCERELDAKVAEERNLRVEAGRVQRETNELISAALQTIGVRLEQSTFRQRVRWLLRGTWTT